MIRPKYRIFVLLFYCVYYLLLCLKCFVFTVYNVDLNEMFTAKCFFEISGPLDPNGTICMEFLC